MPSTMANVSNGNCASSNTDAPISQAKSNSRHIDQERHKVTELEQEKYWLDAEILSLRKQLLDLDAKVIHVDALKHELSETTRNVRNISEAVVAVSMAIVTGNSADLDSCIHKSLKSVSHINQRLLGLLPSLESAVCLSIIDRPVEEDMLSQILVRYTKGICEILHRPDGFVPLVYVSAEASNESLLKVYYVLNSHDKSAFPKALDVLGREPLSTYISGNVQLFLDITRSVIVNIEPEVHDIYRARQFQLPAASIEATLGFPFTEEEQRVNPLEATDIQAINRDNSVVESVSPLRQPINWGLKAKKLT